MNKKSIIFNGIIAGLAIISVIVMLLPINMGFSCLGFAQMALAEEGGIMLALPIILAFAFSIIVLGFAVLTLLTACNVIKSAKAGKAFRIVNLVLSCVGFIFAGFVFAMFVSQGGFLIGFFIPTLFYLALIVLTSIDLAQSKKFNKTIELSQENPQ